jgi:hypothetical protein
VKNQTQGKIMTGCTPEAHANFNSIREHPRNQTTYSNQVRAYWGKPASEAFKDTQASITRLEWWEDGEMKTEPEL